MDEERTFLKAYNDYSNPIFRHCYLRAFSRERAKELVQETFLRFWNQLLGGTNIKNARAFLYRIANNLIIDESRKKRAVSLDIILEEEGLEPADSRPGPAEHLDFRMVLKIIEQLDNKYRDVVIMRYIDDLSPREIAEVVEETENNVSVRIHRGVEKLRVLLNSGIEKVRN